MVRRAIEIVHPASADEAIAWLAASPVAFDSPTNRRYRTAEHLQVAFDSGRRRPEWVWAISCGGEILGVLAALQFGPGAVLEHVGRPDADATADLIAAATADLRRLPDAEVGLFLPPGVSASSPEVATWRRLLEQAGWRLLVERRHFEVIPDSDLALDVPLTLDLRPAASIDQLHGLFREILRGSLDAHNRAHVAALGLGPAAERTVADLTASVALADTWVAFEPGGTRPAGVVWWNLAPGNRGYVEFVGVADWARGRRYGRELLAHATRALVAAGASLLVADTDMGNHPMVDGFEAVGWPWTETRVDFALR